ncbi:nitroreductase family deazaflavin-dependent oxidoreductase [Prescottella agglutinans]|uniref:Nitroreductase family deazaflavin-dependent oxidoreductase n=1 Tax=Prescottella agglutinans TaxID=1644129 RepID=A0A438BIW8_9NOCA|nr:nitroreductase/quinone reductase family protein [Prescottella agglutinans]RVW11000.1 nitroreductase family deazaflavin-dependent oxidoreductase [Prescottella agglutinans]
MARMRTYRQTNPIQRGFRSIGGLAPVSWVFARTLHHVDRPVFRITRGRRTLTSMLTDLPVVMLTTTGARTGVRRTSPLLGLPDGDRIVVIASNYGQADNPSWYHNLRAHPRAEISVAGGAVQQVRAHEVTGAERERLWRLGLSIYPAWAEYQKRAAGRRIPVMVLEPAAD